MKKTYIGIFIFFIALLIGFVWLMSSNKESEFTKYQTLKNLDKAPVQDFDSTGQKNEIKRVPAKSRVNQVRPTLKQLKKIETFKTSRATINLKQADIKIDFKIKNSFEAKGRKFNLISSHFAVPLNDYVPQDYTGRKVAAGHAIVELAEGENPPAQALALVKSKNSSGVAIFTGILKIKFNDYKDAADLDDILVQQGVDVVFELEEQHPNIRIGFFKFTSYDDTLGAYSALKTLVGKGVIERVEVDLIEWLRS